MFNRIIKNFLRLNPSYYAFLSGLFISPLIELIDNASFSTPSNMLTFKFALMGSLCFFIAGILSLATSIELESIKRLSFDEAPRFSNVNQGWETIISKRLPKLSILLLGMIVLLLIGAFFQGYSVVANITGSSSINQTPDITQTPTILPSSTP